MAIKTKFIFILIIFAIKGFSQDTIRFRNGDVKAVKINEVGVNEVKYHDFSYLDGPVYITSKNEVHKIKYKGGGVDTFAIDPVIAKENIIVNNSVVSDPTLKLLNKKVFVYKGRHLNAREADDLFINYPNPEVRNKLMMMNDEIKQHKAKAAKALPIGLGVGFGIVVVGSLFLAFIPEVTVAAIFIGAAIRITGCVSAKVNKNKAAGLREHMVHLYNNGLK